MAASGPLRDFLSELPRLVTSRVPRDVAERVEELAEQAARCEFPAPDGFSSPVEFHALGLSRGRRSWTPPTSGYRTLAVAPFVNRTGLDAVGGLSGSDRTLVSRQEELDRLPEDPRAEWDEVLVLSDSAQGEPEDGGSDHDATGSGAGTGPSGLHAKMIAVEHWHDVTWYVGSANLTAAAFTGGNVEMMASVTGRKGRKGGAGGHGINRFLEGGFRKLCEPYVRTEPDPEDPRVTSARARLEAVRDALLDAGLRVTCVSANEHWDLTIDGSVALPADDVEAVAWPVSVAEDQARPLTEPPSWRLPVARLTAFVAFRLSVPVRGVDDIRMTLRLPAEGMPEDRLHQILRSLLDSPEKFLRFLRALLGGLDAVRGWAQDGGEGNGRGDWGIGLGGETLLEDLLRTASRDPERLKPVRRLIDDLRKTDEGRRIVPDDLFDIWMAVEEAPRAGAPFMKRPSVDASMRPLKSFQRRTVEHAFHRLFTAEDSTGRFLVADEVGLGKTLVARGIIARAIDHLWHEVPRIDIVYICSNGSIARANLPKLQVGGAEERSFALATRLTMLATELAHREGKPGLAGSKLNFVSFTPGTSFNLGHSTGQGREREVLFQLLDPLLGPRTALMNLLQGGITKRDDWRWRLENSPRPIDEAIRQRFEAAFENRPDLGNRLGELLDTSFRRYQERWPPEARQRRDQVIAELRRVLAGACVSALEPDLVILDEFQRFKSLIDTRGTERDPAAELAQELFQAEAHDGKRVRTLPAFRDAVQALHRGRGDRARGALRGLPGHHAVPARRRRRPRRRGPATALALRNGAEARGRRRTGSGGTSGGRKARGRRFPSGRDGAHGACRRQRRSGCDGGRGTAHGDRHVERRTPVPGRRRPVPRRR